MKNILSMRLFPLPYWMAALLCLLSLPLSLVAGLTIEVVDDTGDSHSPFLLLVGKPINTMTPIAIDAHGGTLSLADASQNQTVEPSQISQLAQSPSTPTITSPDTGATRTVRYFTIGSISSMAFMVFRNDAPTAPFTYQNNQNPNPVTANFRFDQCELTFDPTIDSKCNLTSIDQFAVPMQFELFDAKGNLVGFRTSYLNTVSMVKAASGDAFMGSLKYGMDADMAVLGAGNSSPVKGWKPKTTGKATEDFLRIIGPGKLAGGSNGSPAPYPSFDDYLHSLAATQYTFTISGTSNGSDYQYNGKVQAAASGNGFEIVLTPGTITPAPPSPLPANATVTIHLPTRIAQATSGKITLDASGAITNVAIDNAGAGYTLTPNVTVTGGNSSPAQMTATLANGEVSAINVIDKGAGYSADTVTVAIDAPGGSADAFIYGATLSDASFALDPAGSPDQKQKTNSVYGTMVGDALSALNFGFMNGVYGDSGTVWYGTLPTPFAYGNARNPNDGYYNPWAALVYNHSDAYGFAFSDRNGQPDPLLDLEDGQTLRITLLSDTRLDTPIVTASSVTTSGFTLNWPAIDNATGYEVEVLAPQGTESPPINGTGVTFTGLEAGTPYTIQVAATGANVSGQPISSATQPIQVRTAMKADQPPAGEPPSPTDPNLAFGLTLSYNIPDPENASDYKVYFNDQLSTASQSGKSTTWSLVTIEGLNALNQIVLTIMKNRTVLYQGIVEVTLDANTAATATVSISGSSTVPPNQIQSYTVTDGGTGYLAAYPPDIQLSDTGGGGGSVPVVAVANGSVTSIAQKSGVQSSGYATDTNVLINPTFAVSSSMLLGNQQPISFSNTANVDTYSADPGPLTLRASIPFAPNSPQKWAQINFAGETGFLSYGQNMGDGWYQFPAFGNLHMELFHGQQQRGWVYIENIGWAYLIANNQFTYWRHKDIGWFYINLNRPTQAFVLNTLTWEPIFESR